MSPERLRTLIIEDDAEDARALRRLLEHTPSTGVEVVHVERLAAGLELLASRAFDAVLLDLSLPDCEGLRGITAVRELARQVAIVVLTGVDDEATAIRAMQEGAQDYLVKGRVDPDVLVRALRYAVERKRAEENGRRLLMERTRRLQAEAAERRALFLAEAGSQLAAVLDLDEMPHRVAALAVPMLADCCVVDIYDDAGDLQRVATTCAKKEHEVLARTLLRYSPSAARAEHPVMRALRSGQPVLVTDITAEVIESISHDAEHAAILRAIAPRSLMTLPLLARGRTLGAITFVASAVDHTYGAQDLALAWALADRAALAIDNAKLFRAREEMLSVVSHDLRNPLNVITVGVASLRRGVPEDRRATFLEKIRRAADRMNRLIEDLLDVTRLDSGSIALERDVHAVPALVSETLEALRPLAEEKQIRLVNEVQEGTPEVHADRDRMLQIFGNIIGNAIKFTPVGGVVTVRAEPLEGERAVKFSVADSGPGISSADQERIFERFVQAKRSDRKGGTGLGLAIAKGLVQAHGGSIGVASELGLGATFFFSIPTSAGDADGVADAASPLLAASPS